jgi:AraC-like DNA-binding protein
MGARTQSTQAKSAGSGDDRLTKASLMRMELFAPPVPVAPFVTTFFRMRCEEESIRDVQPTSLGMIVLMAKGRGHMRFLDGRREPSHPLMLVTPTTAAATFEIDGPCDCFGAMLSPLGWAGLTGLSAAAHANRVRDGAELLPRPVATAAHQMLAHSGELEPEAIVAALSAAIVASAGTVPPGHAEYIKAVADWLAESLSPQLEDLLTRVPYSPRQVQRLSERYFGLPPIRLARKYRALRAAVLLSRPAISDDEIAAVRDHFYDQSHMIREIRLFAGRTPARIADPDTPYLANFMDLRDFRERGSRMAPIPEDLRG